MRLLGCGWGVCFLGDLEDEMRVVGEQDLDIDISKNPLFWPNFCGMFFRILELRSDQVAICRIVTVGRAGVRQHGEMTEPIQVKWGSGCYLKVCPTRTRVYKRGNSSF
jgi:hypothetical protein